MRMADKPAIVTLGLAVIVAGVAMAQAPAVKEKTAPLGYDLHYLDSKQFAEVIAHDYARYGRVIHDAGIAPE